MSETLDPKISDDETLDPKTRHKVAQRLRQQGWAFVMRGMALIRQADTLLDELTGQDTYRVVRCVSCRQVFPLFESEVLWLAEKGFDRPQRCGSRNDTRRSGASSSSRTRRRSMFERATMYEPAAISINGRTVSVKPAVVQCAGYSFGERCNKPVVRPWGSASDDVLCSSCLGGIEARCGNKRRCRKCRAAATIRRAPIEAKRGLLHRTDTEGRVPFCAFCAERYGEGPTELTDLARERQKVDERLRLAR